MIGINFILALFGSLTKSTECKAGKRTIKKLEKREINDSIGIKKINTSNGS